ncbi:glycosyltransferase family 4 protein, partial [Bacteroidota bacterium]
LHEPIIFIAPDQIIHKELAEELNVQIIGKLNGHLWEQFELPAYLRRKGSPLLLNLANTAPLKYRNQFITIHDISIFINSSWYHWFFACWYKYLMPRIARSCQKVLTVSETSSNEIQKHIHVDREKIKVVYAGISHDLLKANSKSIKLIEGNDFILSISSLHSRKNIGNIISAFKSLNKKDLKLVIAGKQQGLNKKTSNKKLDNEDNSIIETGYVSNEELIFLYKNARCLVFPSLHEGFGLPVLEAMYFGCPVIGSEIDVFKELYSDSLYFVNHNSEESIAKGIKNLLEDDALRNNLINKGKERAKKFDYKYSAKVVLDNLAEKLN